jgi:hypothetical protein
MRRRFLLLCAALALGAPTVAQATTIGFTDASAFHAATFIVDSTVLALGDEK